MNDILKTATDALLKNSTAFQRTANNIANVNTPGYQSESDQPFGVKPEREIVDMIQIKHTQAITLEVVETAEQMRKQLLEIGRSNQRG